MILPGLGFTRVFLGRVLGFVNNVQIKKKMATESSTQRRQTRESPEELLAQLNLREEEDEEEDFVWEEELPDMGAPTKWLAIARVHTPKSFNPNACTGT